MPLEDRAADTWEPLIAIADLAEGDWPARPCDAAATMTQAEAQQEEDTAAGVRLLADLRQVFFAAGAEALYTSTILEALHRLEDAPWADWYGHPLATRDLARLLRPYQVESKDIREHGTGTPCKGYVRADLHDAWARYLPLHPLHELQPTEPAGQTGNGHVADLLPPSATSTTGPGDVADVADERIPSATALTCDVAHVADVAAPATNGNGWRYDQPMVPCAVCATGTTNRAPSGQPLHLACDTRTTTEGPHHG
jgi:hypothetical protein